MSELIEFTIALPADLAEQIRARASLAGIPQEHFLSLVVGVGLLTRVEDED